MMINRNFNRALVLLIVSVLLYPAFVVGQQAATINIDYTKTGAPVSPNLHGIFFEEISHAGEGGLYVELIRNRGFEDSRLP